MEITGNDNWVCIPNEKGEFGEPIFLSKGSILTTNFDQIKVLNQLPENIVNRDSEKDAYFSLSDQKINPTILTTFKTSAEKLGFTVETKYYDTKGTLLTDLSKIDISTAICKTILTPVKVVEPIIITK